MKNQYVLTIIISNYNQEMHIAETIDSVLNQKVDFPYKIIITDDHSTRDRSKEICEHDIERRNDAVVDDKSYKCFVSCLFRTYHIYIIERMISLSCAILIVLLQGISGAWISPFAIAFAQDSNSKT